VLFMVFRLVNGRIFAGLALCGFMLAAAGCQSSDKGILGVGGNQAATAQQEKVKASDLLAYCPKISLREGTAYFSTYARGGQDDASKLIYQASIADVTRDCTRDSGTLTMNVAVAGKVVPGPLGTTGSITMPIRVVVLRGAEVLYSKLHQYKLQVADTSAATQFVFKDAEVSVPLPSASNYQVFAGFDEGPVKAAAQENAKPARTVRRKKPEAAAPVAAKPAAPASGTSTSLSDIPR
jgi:hypothetical protein